MTMRPACTPLHPALHRHPALIMHWVYETKTGGPSKTTIAMLQGQMGKGGLQMIKCSSKELAMLRKEFKDNEAKLDPKWARQQNGKLTDGYRKSFVTLMFRAKPKPSTDVGDYTLVDSRDRHWDIHVPNTSLPIKIYGNEDDECVICLEALSSKKSNALPR